MAKKPKFRAPNDLPALEKTYPISARIDESYLKALKKIAKKNNFPLSYIIKCALEDYVKAMEGDI
jgi:predicted transcriptional regulator